MEFWTSVRVVVRRRYVVLASLWCFAIVGVVLLNGVKPTYEVTGSVVMLRRGQPAGDGAPAVNPWDTVDFAANQFTLLMAQATADPRFDLKLAGRGVSTDRTVTASVDQTAVLTITVIGRTPEEAMTSYRALVDELRREIEARQQSVGAPPETWFSAVDLADPVEAEKRIGSRVQAAVVLVVLAVMTSLGLAFLVDSAAAARRRAGRDRTGPGGRRWFAGRGDPEPGAAGGATAGPSPGASSPDGSTTGHGAPPFDAPIVVVDARPVPGDPPAPVRGPGASVRS